MDEKNQGKAKGYDPLGLVRKVAVGAMIVGAIYAVEKLKPVEWIFPNQGKSVENYIRDIKPEDVQKFPEQYGGLAGTIMNNLPDKNALVVIGSYAKVAPDTIRSDAIKAIYSAAGTDGKCDAIDAIINNSSEPMKFYATEFGFSRLTFGDKVKMMGYGPLDMTLTDVKRPK